MTQVYDGSWQTRIDWYFHGLNHAKDFRKNAAKGWKEARQGGGAGGKGGGGGGDGEEDGEDDDREYVYTTA